MNNGNSSAQGCFTHLRRGPQIAHRTTLNSSGSVRHAFHDSVSVRIQRDKSWRCQEPRYLTPRRRTRIETYGWSSTQSHTCAK